MKAHKVYENIEFERGKDPITAMGIGSLQHIIETMEEFGDKYGLTPVHVYRDDSKKPYSSGEMVRKWVDGYGKEVILYVDDKQSRLLEIILKYIGRNTTTLTGLRSQKPG